MPKITDPDNLTLTLTGTGLGTTADIYVNLATKKIQLAPGFSIDAEDGVTLQCIYSFLKEEWLAQPTFPAYPFPIEAISAAAGIYELRSGWDWENATTRNLIRDGAWSLYNATNTTVVERWINITSLGSVVNPAADQPYFTQQDSTTASTTNTITPGPVNQAVKVFGGPSNGSFDYRSFFKIFLREQGKTYAEYDLLTEQAIAQLEPRIYSFPLSNTTDPKILVSDAGIDANSDNTADVAPYSGMSITYLTGTGFTAWASGVGYALNAVVSFGGRWYRATSAHTSSGPNEPTDGGAPWTAYEGERQVGANYYAYNVIVDGNNGTAEQIYAFLQWSLRRPGDIDAGSGTRNGKVASLLAGFVGDTLITRTGVYIDDFAAADINDLRLTDVSGTQRSFPFTASGTITFNANLQADPSAKYWMFFTDGFATSSFIIVDNAAGTDITGPISGAPSVSFTFDYDGNSQGGRTPGTDAPVTIVAIGTSAAQYVVIEGTIARSNTNSFSLNAATERNYLNA